LKTSRLPREEATKEETKASGVKKSPTPPPVIVLPVIAPRKSGDAYHGEPGNKASHGVDGG